MFSSNFVNLSSNVPTYYRVTLVVEFQVQESTGSMFFLKVSRSPNKIVEPQTLPKNERTFFHSIPTTIQDSKTNWFAHFSGKSADLRFCFEIY